MRRPRNLASCLPVHRPLRRAAVLAVVCAALVSGCLSPGGLGSTPGPSVVDADGRWVGGEEKMEAWTDSRVPAGWNQVDQSVSYFDIIDDLGKDVGRDETVLAAEYRGVTEDELARFGAETLQIDRDLECEPYDPAFAAPKEEPSVKSCYLDLFQGENSLSEDFEVFVAWTSYPDGSTTTELWLTHDPS